MTKDEALKLALETLEADPLEMVADANGHMVFLKDKAITAIKEHLKEKALQALHDENERLGLYKDAYAEQEPMAWISTGPARMIHWTSDKPAYGDDWVPLYTTPPQRTWVGDLEDIDINITWNENSMRDFGKDELAFARAILLKAQEK